MTEPTNGAPPDHAALVADADKKRDVLKIRLEALKDQIDSDAAAWQMMQRQTYVAEVEAGASYRAWHRSYAQLLLEFTERQTQAFERITKLLEQAAAR